MRCRVLPRSDAEISAELTLAQLRERQCRLLLRPWWHRADVPESVRELRRVRARHREACWRLANLDLWRLGCARAMRERRAREREQDRREMEAARE